MYEIWSVGHKPFEKYTNNQVSSMNIIKKVTYVHFIQIS